MAFMVTLSCGCSLSIYCHWVYELVTKALIILSTSINIHSPYVCVPLSSYISLFNNSIDPIIPYWSIFINIH